MAKGEPWKRSGRSARAVSPLDTRRLSSGCGIRLAGRVLGTLGHEVVEATPPGNYLGLPGGMVPAGLAAGLPVGVQVMGPIFSDLRCLTLAEQSDQVLGLQAPIEPVDVRQEV
ncbi:MAG: hypothetical protein F2934_09010 [Actinobacteria bacterium]|nr:hypothetical protein [Actinomycetota bacterium]MSY13045.1 hypothetical protein [Actinomycetota bacterium]MSZ04897.1 hypothetical protein [Actinomycetota bacterium]MTB07250.1 hypothetical protein [Actinomycetota bacterium]